MFWPCTKWRKIFTRVGLFQTLNAALSSIEFAKKHSAMLKNVKTAYLAEKLKIWFHKHFNALLGNNIVNCWILFLKIIEFNAFLREKQCYLHNVCLYARIQYLMEGKLELVKETYWTGNLNTERPHKRTGSSPFIIYEMASWREVSKLRALLNRQRKWNTEVYCVRRLSTTISRFY